MTRTASPRLIVYLAVSALGVLAGVLFHRVDAVVLAVPFVLTVVAGLASVRDPHLEMSAAIDGERFVEGDEVTVTTRLSSPLDIGRVEVAAEVPTGLVALAPRAVGLRARRGATTTWELPLRCGRWGTYALGAAVVRVRDRSGLFTFEGRLAAGSVARVHPGTETVRTLVRARRVQAVAGNHVARQTGSGIEHADLRAYVPGDRIREVNWRATARRGALWVNQRHPERSTDVVVFLDSFTSTAIGPAVRVAVTLVEAYLRDRDRVGLVSFGGSLSWVRPGMGPAQQHRVVDHLLGTAVHEHFVWKGIDVVPPGTLPPRALLVAVSSLEDDRVVAALSDLRNRGIDLAVIEIAPVGSVTASSDPGDELARRVWVLRREVVKDRYRRLGMPVVEWRDDRLVESVLEEVQAFRRHGHRSVG